MAISAVIFHPDAEQEYLTSLEWYRDRSVSAAEDFEEEFTRAIAKIREAPDRWPTYAGVCRRYILRQFPFSIVYRIFPSHVLVLAVPHGHRRPGYWKKRLRWKAPESAGEQ
jgi:plasmid stabilization system protein ParE